MDGYLLPGSALSDRKKASIELIINIIYFCLSCLLQFQFFYFKFSFYFIFAFVLPTMLEYELFNFALNVCVFFLVYIICNIEGAASFFQCSCLLIEVLTICMYVCVCTHVCACTLLSALARLPYCVVVEFNINR